MRRRDHRAEKARKPAWDRWYSSPNWRALRAAQLARKPLCEYCEARGRVVPATVANHDPPHRGDWAAFHDPARLRSACKPCHDGAIQSYEKTGHMRGVTAEGFPIDPSHPWNRKDNQ